MGHFGNVIDVRNDNHKTYKLDISTVGIGSRGRRNEFASTLPVEIGEKADNMYCPMYLFFCKTPLI